MLGVVAHDPEVPAVEVLLCEVGEQAPLLREGRADTAVMHKLVNDLTGLDN